MKNKERFFNQTQYIDYISKHKEINNSDDPDYLINVLIDDEVSDYTNNWKKAIPKSKLDMIIKKSINDENLYETKKSCSCGCGGTCKDKNKIMENKLRQVIRQIIREEFDMSSLDTAIDSLSDAIVTLRSVAKNLQGEDQKMLFDVAEFLDTMQYDMTPEETIQENKKLNKKSIK